MGAGPPEVPAAVTSGGLPRRRRRHLRTTLAGREALASRGLPAIRVAHLSPSVRVSPSESATLLGFAPRRDPARTANTQAHAGTRRRTHKHTQAHAGTRRRTQAHTGAHRRTDTGGDGEGVSRRGAQGGRSRGVLEIRQLVSRRRPEGVRGAPLAGVAGAGGRRSGTSCGTARSRRCAAPSAPQTPSRRSPRHTHPALANTPAPPRPAPFCRHRRSRSRAPPAPG